MTRSTGLYPGIVPTLTADVGDPSTSELQTGTHGEGQGSLIRSGALRLDDKNHDALLVVRHVDINVPLYPVTPMRIAGATPEVLQKAIHDFEAISVWGDEVFDVELTSHDRLPIGPRARQVPCLAHIVSGLTDKHYRPTKVKRPALADLPIKASNDQVPSGLEVQSKGLGPSPFALIANKENEHPNKQTSEQALVRSIGGNHGDHPSSHVQALNDIKL
ncbi:hypothetical protein LTR56_001475 [Elasticomyces elasticus]|nr:hypothetical protein LTR56_001475 [Elasticomyces elasticus]KAK3668602.1 hypothetical protein LTR22_000489 [Elasticomyces elasticus]KAK4931954.1 hypothetical protein LTR49_001641 [Elasticomyces elasticus]KAK5768514.1 hypothetical protein LTS12_001302 [Elasticomyces elasticus]